MSSEKTIARADNNNRNLAVAFIFAALFLSGFACLSYEILWQRLLVRLMGASLSSIALIFSLFMGGLAAGSLLSVVMLRQGRWALPLYASIEAAVALVGAIMPFAFSQGFIDAFPLHTTRPIASMVLFVLRFLYKHHIAVPDIGAALDYAYVLLVMVSGRAHVSRQHRHGRNFQLHYQSRCRQFISCRFMVRETW